MAKINHYQSLATKRKKRVRAKVMGTAARPRLSVFRSNKNTYLQVIDDMAGKTVASANDLQMAKSSKVKGTKTEKAVLVTKDLIKKLKNNKIEAVKFDRGSRKYHGRLKAVAETLREAGINV